MEPQTVDALMLGFPNQLACAERLAYNINGLFGGEDVKRTIEFRQHESTPDTEGFRHWIATYISIVKFALAANKLELEFFSKSTLKNK